MGPSHLPVQTTDPVQARRMSKRDIADLRRWHRAAVDRSLRAGYDLVYVYAAHGLTTLQHFLSRRYNDRTDEYGGSIENRARLLREILEDTVEQVAGRAAVACRICVDEQLGDRGIDRGEIEAVLGLVGELPDVWDFMVGEWEFDSVTSRFAEEGAQEQYVRGLKALTSKPVVGVGRFTSADTMVRMVRDGVLDMIGAARPSIADPFLPAEDRGGPLGRHPRVHRLQHLRHGRRDRDADPLHPEPEHGRGVAPRLASRADPAEGLRRERARRRRRPGRPRGRDDARPPRLRRRAGRGGRRGRRPGAARGAAAGPGRLDPRRRLPPQPARAPARTSRSASAAG